MSFREHLRELRSVLVRITIALIIGFFVCWEFRVEIFGFLSRPIAEALADRGIYHFQAIQITESIMVYLKTAFMADLALVSPFVFYQLWSFIGPGLHKHERRFVLPLTAFSVVFFLIGASFSYTVLLPFITDWLVALTYDAGNVEVLVTLQNAYSFAFTFLIMFGLVFELPLLIFFLALFGTASARGLLKFWRYFAVLSLVISAMLTPPEPLSQILMAVPLNLLYGFGILVAWTVTRARENNEKAGAKALQMMAVSLLAAGVLATALILVIKSIPDKPLVDYVPQRAAWAVGINPGALSADERFARRAATAPGVLRLTRSLKAAGSDPAVIKRAIIIGRDDGLRAAVLRGEGLGQAAASIREALAAARDTKVLHKADLVAASLGEDTLLFGQRNLVVDILAVGQGAPGAPRDAADQRLLKRLTTGGPAWGWLPVAAGDGEKLLGDNAADDVSTAGVVLALGERPKLSLQLRALDDHIDALDAQLESARSTTSSAVTDRRQLAVVDALSKIARELATLAPAASRDRIAAIETSLRDLDARDHQTTMTLFKALAPYARGWSVRRNDAWFTATSDLAEDGLTAMIGWVAP